MKTTYIVAWKCFMSLRPGQWAGQQHQYLINQELLIHSSHMTLGNVMHQRETRDHCTSVWYDPVSEDLNLVLYSMCLSLASEKVRSLSICLPTQSVIHLQTKLKLKDAAGSRIFSIQWSCYCVVAVVEVEVVVVVVVLVKASHLVTQQPLLTPNS